jgi:Tfp pilus assembly protein PilP
MRIAFALILLALATPAAAQSQAAPATTAPAASPAAPAANDVSGYTYNPEGRRDPFVSLLRRAAESQRLPAGARPMGLSGLSIGEVALKGILRGQDGYIGILLGADSRSYIVRPGDKLLDGTVRAIAADSLVIAQQVNDPLSPQKQREVRKMLRQPEEAR